MVEEGPNLLSECLAIKSSSSSSCSHLYCERQFCRRGKILSMKSQICDKWKKFCWLPLLRTFTAAYTWLLAANATQIRSPNPAIILLSSLHLLPHTTTERRRCEVRQNCMDAKSSWQVKSSSNVCQWSTTYVGNMTGSLTGVASTPFFLLFLSL